MTGLYGGKLFYWVNDWLPVREGNYNCACPKGYLVSEDKQCVDINECEEQDGLCAERCINLIGTYECACNEGQSLALGLAKFAR